MGKGIYKKVGIKKLSTLLLGDYSLDVSNNIVECSNTGKYNTNKFFIFDNKGNLLNDNCLIPQFKNSLMITIIQPSRTFLKKMKKSKRSK